MLSTSIFITQKYIKTHRKKYYFSQNEEKMMTFSIRSEKNSRHFHNFCNRIAEHTIWSIVYATKKNTLFSYWIVGFDTQRAKWNSSLRLFIFFSSLLHENIAVTSQTKTNGRTKIPNRWTFRFHIFLNFLHVLKLKNCRHDIEQAKSDASESIFLFFLLFWFLHNFDTWTTNRMRPNTLHFQSKI